MSRHGVRRLLEVGGMLDDGRDMVARKVFVGALCMGATINQQWTWFGQASQVVSIQRLNELWTQSLEAMQNRE